MANALNRNLEENEVVIVRKNYLAEQYKEGDRRFVCRGGFGMRSFTMGEKIFGYWTMDGTDDFIPGRAISIQETEEYQEKNGKFGENDPNGIPEKVI